MSKSKKTNQKSLISVTCPYCGKDKSIEPPKDCGPAYVSCNVCDRRFIVVKPDQVFQALTIDMAPCSSSDANLKDEKTRVILKGEIA